MKHFIFGYGSLICPQSRAITAPTLRDVVAEPVVISHIERTWSARVTRRQAKSSTGGKTKGSNQPPQSSSASSGGRDHIRGWTPMGVRFRQGARCNGVLICVDEEELMRFDRREAGYDRRQIDLADIHPHLDSDVLIDESMSLWPKTSADVHEEEDLVRSSLREELALKGVRCSDCRLVFEKASEKRRQSSGASDERDTSKECEDIAVWVFVQSNNLPAERSFPITQSYVDIIMRGCLSISHDFARRFLETTQGWWNDGPVNPNDNENDTQQKAVEDAANADLDGDERKVDIDSHHTWVNDRHDPMYVRADSEYSMENGEAIDRLIEEHHPRALQRRVTSM